MFEVKCTKTGRDIWKVEVIGRNGGRVTPSPYFTRTGIEARKIAKQLNIKYNRQ